MSPLMREPREAHRGRRDLSFGVDEIWPLSSADSPVKRSIPQSLHLKAFFFLNTVERLFEVLYWHALRNCSVRIQGVVAGKSRT